MRARLLVAPFLVLLWTGCKCGQTVATVVPTLGVSPVSLDFGPVKVGTPTGRAARC